MSETLLNKVYSHFQLLYDKDPILVFSPGRINLIGEHTDYNDGFVFPAAIDKGIALAIKHNDANLCRAHAFDIDENYEFQLKNLSPLINGGWKNYIIGVVAEILKAGHQLKGFDVIFSGNIPSGAGLSSSAALENSLVFALNALFGLGLSKTEMILISQKAEHNYVGVKCGIMDQYASMFGVKDHALLLDCRTLNSEKFKVNLKGYEIVLVNSQVKHSLNESAYNDRRQVCETISKQLGVKALRDVSVERLETIKHETSFEDYQKALYVIQENQRVIEFSEALQNNDIHQLGRLLFEAHDGLSNQYKVSCDEIDFLVDFAKNNPNVIGSRMMGGGFGGCTINLVKKDYVNKFIEDVKKRYKEAFHKDCKIHRVVLSEGTRLINNTF
ncbi:galactokinase [Psychroserpens sp. XS_ASV72]|uniref:galactokinase n=1 Tax=Psychroserpens sp. XS_ASV72 TaxID=3241293 RepID=UPI003515EEA2